MTARILTLPRTVAGRQLLRQSVLERGGSWDFPDAKAEDTHWDDLAADIARMLLELDEIDRESDAYLAWRAQQ